MNDIKAGDSQPYFYASEKPLNSKQAPQTSRLSFPQPFLLHAERFYCAMERNRIFDLIHNAIDMTHKAISN